MKDFVGKFHIKTNAVVSDLKNIFVFIGDRSNFNRGHLSAVLYRVADKITEQKGEQNRIRS